MTNLIIAHGGHCPDGFTAAWVLARRFPAAEILYANYTEENFVGENLSIFKDKDIVIIDYCFSRQDLLKVKAIAKSLLVLDHHKTAMEACGDLDFCFFDMNRSGAGLAWDFAQAGEIREGSLPYSQITAPWLVRYIEYRDLGFLYRNETHEEGIKEVLAAVDSYPQTFEMWDELASRDPKELIAEGKAILRFKNKIVEQLASSAVTVSNFRVSQAFGINLLNGQVLSVNSPIFQSDIGNFLVKQNPDCIGMVWYSNDKHTKFSLRSENQDCSLLAEQVLGGGGHKRASGFHTDPVEFDSLIRDNRKIEIELVDENNNKVVEYISYHEMQQDDMDRVLKLKFNTKGLRLHKIGGSIYRNNWQSLYYIDNELFSESGYKAILDEVRNMPQELRLTDRRWWVREWK